MSKKTRRKRAVQRAAHQNKYRNKIGQTKPQRAENIRKIEVALAERAELDNARPFSVCVRETDPRYRHLLTKNSRSAGKNAEGASNRSAKVEDRYALAHKEDYPKRGDIWFADLGDHYGTSVQSGERPVLIISNDMANRYSETVSVLPLTSRMKKLNLCTHVLLSAEDCIKADSAAWGSMKISIVLAEQVTTMSKKDLCFFFCRVSSGKKLRSIERAVADQLGLYHSGSACNASACNASAGGASANEGSITAE